MVYLVTRRVLTLRRNLYTEGFTFSMTLYSVTKKMSVQIFHFVRHGNRYNFNRSFGVDVEISRRDLNIPLILLLLPTKTECVFRNFGSVDVICLLRLKNRLLNKISIFYVS